MVEEAAGTRMFEERKDKAKKTMGKKEKRVQEITSLLEEEITPKLDTLRAEKRSFLEWQKSVSELERIERMLRAFEWTDGKARVEEKEEEVNRQQAATKRVQKDKTRFSREIEAAETEAQEVAAARDKELKKGGKFKKLEEDALELGKTVEKIRTQVELKQGSISDEENKVIGLLEELEEVSSPYIAHLE